MNQNDIKFYYSGSGTAVNPELSLGGPRASQEVVELFDTVSAKKSRAGLIDYRCFYIKNTHADETLRNAKFYVDWERKSGSLVDVGVKHTKEVQAVEIMGSQPPNENDSMTLNLPTYGDFTVDYHVNITEWQGRFLTSIRGLDGMQDVQVEVAGEIGFPTNVVFTVYFLGQADSRKLQLMTVVQNNLDFQSISIVEIKEGSPISVTACTIPAVTTAPACVNFEYPLRGSPIELGDLRPNDEFPVWLRRTTPSNTRIHLLDKIRLNVEGTFP